MGRLNEKVAVVTGGTRGLGLGIARAYAAEGAAVVIGSRSEASVTEAVRMLRRGGARVEGLPCDVANIADVEALGERAISAFGSLDIWVNNAGVAGPYGPTYEWPMERFGSVVATNIMGTYHGSMVALRHFLPRGQGKLINMLGRGDRGPVPLQNGYGSSKTWVRTFTLALAKEHERSGLGIFALNPGMVQTEMLTHPQALPGWEEKLEVMPTIIRMWANPPEVPAERAVWLASRATDGRTGLEVQVLGKGRLLSGVFREGVRRLLGKK